MFKRVFQTAVAFVAVAFFVLAPIACQKAEKPDETPKAAETTAGHPSGKKLMAAKPKKAEEAVAEVVEEVPVAEEAEVPVEGE